MTEINRRDVLRLGSFGLAGALLPWSRALRAAELPPPVGNEKLLFVFLRGAMDPLHVVLPVGDPTFDSYRGSGSPLYVADRTALQGTSYAVLNSDWAALTGPGSPDAAGKLAWLYQVGNPLGERSHFTEQRIYETAEVRPAYDLADEGFVPRLSQQAGFGRDLPAASLSEKMQRMFLSTDPDRILAHIPALAEYDLEAEGSIGAVLRTALATHYAGQNPLDGPAKDLDSLGEFMPASESVVRSLPALQHDGAAFPTDNQERLAAGLPNLPSGYELMRHSEEALHLLRNSVCRVAGIEAGGWDTHDNQTPRRAALDPWLAYALRSLWNLSSGITDPITICVVTEFGRSRSVNASDGTDHGVGGLCMVIGERVNGGVYNCHGGGGLGALWTPLGNLGDEVLEVAKDWRTIHAELLGKLFGLGKTELDVIIPGWAELDGSGPLYEEQGFLT